MLPQEVYKVKQETFLCNIANVIGRCKEDGHPAGDIEPRNSSWITKVRASSWRTWQKKKMSHHQRGDHDFFYFTMHTNILHVCFAPNCRF